MRSNSSRFLRSIFQAVTIILFAAVVHGQDKVTYFLTDLQGSAVAATDQNGNVVWREDYAPYGERRAYPVTGDGNHNWYLSKSVDVDTNLSYLGSRSYDPALGRFYGIDSVGVSAEDPVGSFNRYAYARNNPFASLDPNGREAATAEWLNRTNRFFDAMPKSTPTEAAIILGVAGLPFLAAGVFVLPEALAAAPFLNSAAITIAEVSAGDALGGASLVSGGGAAVYRGAKFARAAARELRTAETWGNAKTLARHFRDHGADFGAKSADEYAAQASQFFRRSQAERLPTKIDADGVIRVYDSKTNTFGAFNPGGTARTFFKPKSPTYWDRQPGSAPRTP